MAAKIKKGDKVVVLAGRDKGRTGEVPVGRSRATARASSRASTWSSATPARRAQTEGGIMSKEAPIHLSNLAIADPKTASRPASASRSRGRPQGPRSPSVPEI